ncbi:hypothetical protein K488DRAFT_44336 [Vararia minispora EC-137]|uniref:Uncharacterized protein n=1 Tax=Vararia minispora EC-137 TaxID=1314806 RepID=A0ACB8QSV5_9AGAM|nr:hypothetical protein K488DRAFT_44336 [Vararia minispora EC-137]
MSSLTLARAYRHSFETHPNLTLAAAGATLTAIGDAVAQTTQSFLEEDKNKHTRSYDFPRTIRFFCYGAVISPIVGRWNKFLEVRFPLRSANTPGRTSFRAVAKRVATDQIVMAPVGLAIFFSSMGVMEGRDRDHIVRKFRDLYVPALEANWKVWPLAQLLNFSVIPLPYRVPFSQSCGVFWTLYLSLINSQENQSQERQDKMAEVVREK